MKKEGDILLQTLEPKIDIKTCNKDDLFKNKQTNKNNV